MRNRISWHELRVAALAALVAAGCGGEQAQEQPAAEGVGAAQAPVVDPATAAAVTGNVAFQGAAPEPRRIDMSEEPVCAEKHPQGPFTESVVVNANGTLKNVFVHVKEGLGALSFPAPQQPVTLDQNGCIYHPHVFGIQASQSLVIKNSDGILHNINARPSVNRGFNISQPTTMESTRTFAMPEVMVPVKCDVHGWMEAYVGVLPHPYFAVTGDDGSFTIPNLPPGQYVIEAWHERYGTQTQTVTVAARETGQISFTYSESMAAGAVVPLGEPIDLHDHATGGHPPARTPAGASR